MTRLAIVVLFTGLMGSAMAADEAAPVPAQQTPVAAQQPAVAVKTPGSDKVIADILAASGVKKTLEKMPADFVAGFHEGLEQAQSEKGRRLPADVQQALESSAKDAFTAAGFTGRVTRALKKDYSERFYQDFLADLTTPLARRMADLEANAPQSKQEMADFKAQLANNPLPAQRADLLHRLDVATRTSDLLFTAMLSISKGMMRGMAGANGNCLTEAQLKNAEASMEAKIDLGRENVSSTVVNMMAFVYRDVVDADLAEYVRMYEKDNAKHIQNVMYAAIVEEYSQASTRMGRGIMKSFKEKKAAAGNQACEDSGSTAATAAPAQPQPTAQAQPAAAPNPAASAVPATAPATVEQEGSPAVSKSSIPLEKRQGGDITQCLEAGSKSDKDIAACAEKFRH